MKKWWLMIALLSVLLVIGGCFSENENSGDSNGESSNEQSAGENNEGVQNQGGSAHMQELIIVDQEIAASLDPVKPLTSSYLVALGAGEALFKVNAEGKVEPNLAESAKAVDATTWEIKLRANARFWSGRAIDTDAVMASFERSRELDLQALPFLQELTFSKLDDYTLQVKTAREHLDVPLNLSYYQTLIHNAQASHESVETMDLTGMYKVSSFIPKQRMELVKNEDYWGTKPVISRVVHEEISDEQTRVLSALSGRSHIAHKMPVTALAQLEGSNSVRISAAPASNTQTIYLNLKQAKLQDVRVRQALSWAIDREELIALAAEGQSVPVTTWLSSNPAYAEARDAVYPQQDLARAAELLEEAGWKLDNDGLRRNNGEVLSLRLMTWGGDKALGEVLQSQWTRIGIKAEVRHGDYSLITTARGTGDWDASIEAWGTFGEELSLLSGQYSPTGSANYGGFNDERTNELLVQLGAASDDTSRRQLALAINAHVAEQAPVISLYPRPQVTAVSRKLDGFVDHFRPFENLVNANLRIASQ